MRADPNVKPLAPWELERIAQSRIRRHREGKLYQQTHEVPPARRVSPEEHPAYFRADLTPVAMQPAPTSPRVTESRKKGGKAGGEKSAAKAAARKGITLHDAATLAEKGRRGAAATKAAAAPPIQQQEEHAPAPVVEDTPAGPQFTLFAGAVG